IFEIKLADFSQTQLTNITGFNGLPEYSPDGKQIAFHSCDNTVCDIYLMNADGTDLVNLTNGVDDNRWPRWSPDGKWIAITKTINKNSEIYFLSPEGEAKPVITSPHRDEIAIFKPQ
ncbi:translocation protein TolB, partial [Fulvivirga sp. RKSG066]|nr:translocation protein TolB [Fulvivirga aurantia]